MIKARLKGALRSMTIWFNSIAGTLLVLIPVMQQSLPELQGYIPDDIYRQLMCAVIIVNILLRFRTTMDLADKVN